MYDIPPDPSGESRLGVRAEYFFETGKELVCLIVG